MEVVVPSMKELVSPALYPLPEEMPETAVDVAAAEDTDAAHLGTKCYLAAAGVIEMGRNEKVKKSCVDLRRDWFSYLGCERKYQVCDNVDSSGNLCNTLCPAL